jgi:acetyl-CoA synthetase
MKDRIDTLLDEQRSFPAPQAFRAAAHVPDDTVYRRASDDREGYWAEWARQLEGSRPWEKVLDWKPPHARWFVGGTLDASVRPSPSGASRGRPGGSPRHPTHCSR